MEKLLLLLEPFARECRDSIERIARVVEDHGLRLVVEVEDLRRAIDEILELGYVSRAIAIVDELPRDVDIDTIVEACKRAAEICFGGKDFRVEVRRWDKTFPITSIELARAIARDLEKLGLSPRVRAVNTLFIGIDSTKIYIGCLYPWTRKERSYIPREAVSQFVAVVERVQTPYEVMDLIQLSRALGGLELRLVQPRREAVEEALKALGIEMPSHVKIVESYSEALEGVDIVVVLTPYARQNEAKLVELLCRSSGRVAFVLGNEYEDVSIELRSRGIEIRLGPKSEMPMRTAVALSYALGIALTVRAGYIPCDEIVASER